MVQAAWRYDLLFLLSRNLQKHRQTDTQNTSSFGNIFKGINFRWPIAAENILPPKVFWTVISVKDLHARENWQDQYDIFIGNVKLCIDTINCIPCIWEQAVQLGAMPMIQGSRSAIVYMYTRSIFLWFNWYNRRLTQNLVYNPFAGKLSHGSTYMS